MAKVRNTPEEQLLSLIEEGKDFARLKHKRKKVSFGSGGIAKIREGIESFYKSIQSKLRRQAAGAGPDADLKFIISVLLITAIGLSGYLVVDFVFGGPDISHIYQRPLSARQAEPISITGEEGKSFLSYLAMVQRRNIFSPIIIETAQPDEQKVQQKIKDEAGKLAGTLRIAGILLGPVPQVMIENKEANETLFLKKGDIINKLTVEDIFQDRVVLSYEGETVELF
jgi:hypothetical protein